MSNLTTVNSESWNLSNYEIGYNVERGTSHNYCGLTGSRNWNLYIPKIMPLITHGTCKTKTVALNSSIFINNKDCKPTVSRSVISQNFITVPKHPKATFENKYKKHGIKVEIEVLNDNVDNMRITDTYDESHFYPPHLI